MAAISKACARPARLFRQGAAHLTLGEAALLVALPQSPERRRPDRNAKAAQAGPRQRARALAERGVVSPRAAQEAMEEPSRGADGASLQRAASGRAGRARRAAGRRHRHHLDARAERSAGRSRRARSPVVRRRRQPRRHRGRERDAQRARLSRRRELLGPRRPSRSRAAPCARRARRLSPSSTASPSTICRSIPKR